MRSGWRSVSLGLLLVAPFGEANADLVVLQNGVRMTGVLETNADGESVLRVSQDGLVVLDSSTIVSVQRQTKAENSKLVAGWAASEAEAEAAAREEKKFAERQRAKGLVLYRGEWMTPSQFDRQLESDKLDKSPVDHRAVVVNNVSVSMYSYRSVSFSPGFWLRSEAPRRVYATPASGDWRNSYGHVRSSLDYNGSFGVRHSPIDLYDRQPGLGAVDRYRW